MIPDFSIPVSDSFQFKKRKCRLLKVRVGRRKVDAISCPETVALKCRHSRNGPARVVSVKPGQAGFLSDLSQLHPSY